MQHNYLARSIILAVVLGFLSSCTKNDNRFHPEWLELDYREQTGSLYYGSTEWLFGLCITRGDPYYEESEVFSDPYGNETLAGPWFTVFVYKYPKNNKPNEITVSVQENTTPYNRSFTCKIGPKDGYVPFTVLQKGAPQQ